MDTTETRRITVHATEVRKAARDVRRFVGATLALLDAADLDAAYRAAEAAQHAAFDMKALIQNGGKYEPPQDDAAERTRYAND